MDYYEKFKPEVHSQVKGFARTVETLMEQIPKVRQRLRDEKDNTARLNGRIKKLTETATESLASDESSYEKYKTSLKKLHNELAVSLEVVTSLADVILPKAEKELAEAKTNLRIKLEQLVVDSRRIVDLKINSLLLECLSERQGFLDSFAKIYMDYGLVFVASNESFCPGIWNGREAHDLRLRLGLETPEPIQDDQTATAEPEQPAAIVTA